MNRFNINNIAEVIKEKSSVQFNLSNRTNRGTNNRGLIYVFRIKMEMSNNKIVILSKKIDLVNILQTKI